MKAGIQIKIGSIEDAQSITELGRKAFISAFVNEKNKSELLAYVDESFTEKAIQAEFEAPGNVFITFWENDKLLGFSRLLKEQHEELICDKPIKMERLYLDPKIIGKGIGAQLMEASIDFAKEKGCDKLWLQVFEPNTKATEFYYRYGMKLFAYAPGKFESDKGRDLCLYLDIN